MNRRGFLTAALQATAAGLLVPEWILDPPKGRSMVSVPGGCIKVWRMADRKSLWIDPEREINHEIARRAIKNGYGVLCRDPIGLVYAFPVRVAWSLVA